MSPTSSQSPTQGNSTPAPHTSDSIAAAWSYNDRLRIITHEARTCHDCFSWAHHYMAGVFDNDASLRRAEEQRDNHIRGALVPGSATLRENNDALRREVLALRGDLEGVRADLRRVRRERDGADDEVRHLRVEDRDDAPTHPAAAHPHLLSRLTIPSASASSSSLPLAEVPPRSSTELSSLAGRDFVSCITEPAPGAANPVPNPLALTLTAPSFAPTPIAIYVGFPSLLPVLYYAEDRSLVAAPGSACLDTHGDVDFNAHARFVLATGGLTPDGLPAWRTTMTRRERFLTPQAIAARAERRLIPLLGIPLGGMNGVLISPEADPTTEAAVDKLFTTPKRRGHAAGYVERIRFTPPELRGEFHSRALKRWQELYAERCETPGASAPRRAEPSPCASIGVWKRWLKDSREHPQTGGMFKYVGIPLVGQGYQTAHIEGTRALLSFLPLTIKGTTVRGPLRDALLCAAAALLCVPEHYMQVLAQLGQGVAQGRRALYYVEGRLGTAANFGVNEVAQFLASVGVTSDEAEQWRPWAAAFIEMELEGRPNGRHAQMLRQARDSARACIDSDPKWVFKNIHADAPGNYNPALEQSRAMRSMARQAEAGSSSNAEAGPSSAAGDGEVHIRPAHSDAADDCDVHLDHEGEQNDELRMAPA